MSGEENNAFAGINPLLLTSTVSPSKLVTDEIRMLALHTIPALQGLFNTQNLMSTSTPEQRALALAALTDGQKPSASNETSPRDTVSPEGATEVANTTTTTRQKEAWMECYNCIAKPEFNALIYSLYVMEKDDKKLDGWTNYECFNRLQSKCRYKARSKKQGEFYIVEEKGCHNHGVEPVGTGGSHAGLPKTLREIVDKAYIESWKPEDRAAALATEAERLGLPQNPRICRQIDNRVAYLRRIKYQPPSPTDPVNQFDTQLLQMLIDQNGGSMSVGTDMLNQLLRQAGGAALVENEPEPMAVDDAEGNSGGEEAGPSGPTVTITTNESSESQSLLEEFFKQQQLLMLANAQNQQGTSQRASNGQSTSKQ